MTWNPPDPYASLILSIGGGVLAGMVVVALEWAWRVVYELHKKRTAVKELSEFFHQWEITINSAEGLLHPESRHVISREIVQFAQHKNRLWAAPIVLSRLSKHLPDKEAQEISLLIAGHEHAEVGIIPEGRVLPQQMYDRFFGEIRKIGLLKF